MWEKIVLNLLSNAFKFTLEGGIEVRLRDDGSAVELIVKDTGSGIPESELPHLFERFHRVEGTRGRSFEGSGIGLALVQELVKLHGGNVSVESVLAQGSTFKVSVPKGKAHLPQDRIEAALTLVSTSSRADSYVEEAMRWIPAVSGNASAHTSSLPDNTVNASGIERDERSTVLLADDNADMREYVQRLLQKQYRVIAVTNGKEALDAALRESPDLVLTDVMMPAMDGFELMTALRSDPATRTIPIVMLSARAGEESRIEGLQLGADDYLIKPFTERELLARIGAHLALSKLRKELLEREREQARQEIKQRKRAEEASALLAAIVQSSDDAIISKDLNAIITSWNRGAEQIFGYTAEEAVGQPITFLMPPERLNEEPELLERIRSGQRVEHYETVRRRKNGTLLDISLTISPIFDIQGEIVGASKIARDISDRKRMEATLLKAHGLGAAGRMAASIAHEINNPLEAVTNLLYLMRSDVTSETGTQNLATAEAELARVAQITKKTLAYYRDTSKPEPVDLCELITETLCAFVNRIDDKRIVVIRTDQPCTVPGLKWELQQLFSNLVANAIDAVGECGRIEVSCRETGDATVVTVRDNGIGISPNHISRLFEPFFTTKEQHMGTGLGLWISKEVAQKHRAEIAVESSTDASSHGTAFTVTFSS
jgi:PAS domain S-box-containing protein